MKKLFVLAVAVMALGIAQMSFAANLVDVPSGHWAEDAVQKLVDSGLIEGYPDKTFKGDRPLTRYEYVMVVARMVEVMDNTYCSKEDCKAAPAAIQGVSDKELEEIKGIIKKFAAEFKDELAALKVKVDENSAKIAKLEKDVSASRIGNITVSGNIRQRVDIPNTDLSNSDFNTGYYNAVFNTAPLTNTNGLTTGYEMLPYIQFTGQAGDGVDFSLALEKSLRTAVVGYDSATEQDLVINHAYVDIDFSSTVRELDLLKVKSGYQQFDLGPYAMLVDNSGVTSNPAIRLDVEKDLVSITGIGALVGITALDGTGALQGLGSGAKDPYAAVRLGLDLPWLDLGFNYLANGVDQEKGWGADIVAPLLQSSPFLTEVRAEYLTVTDLDDGTSVGNGLDDNSFIIGLDVYKTSRTGLTVSYADIPAAVSLSSLDANPFTEFDGTCPVGLDVAPTSGNCYSFESDKNLFPAGFEGLGIEASYIILSDVELAGKAVIGNYAGGSLAGRSDGDDYPGFGAVSLTKPINDSTKFRVEYTQQGQDPILLNRVRGELLINF